MPRTALLPARRLRTDGSWGADARHHRPSMPRVPRNHSQIVRACADMDNQKVVTVANKAMGEDGSVRRQAPPQARACVASTSSARMPNRGARPKSTSQSRSVARLLTRFRLHCRFVLPLSQFIPDSLRY
jgi:hypothetical protein